jgi:hypothetical protein
MVLSGALFIIRCKTLSRKWCRNGLLDVDLGSFVLALWVPPKIAKPCVEIAWSKRYAGVRNHV